ncbi:hypothetical protein [Sphaerospermopsis torques-reginae]|jgi:hypothetical protein|uniref:Uncharacterized protein n=1 Tax=Sphaerospermopsis torques-reginae ITEP-024 TaxID=984208 RepID=A0ABX8X2U2_9CYAN|nr:hypothetical protein [Sphaerospermopsis torques-reginae]QYX33030.1 hypothetical protein K2F26_06750 [Sphaerospermopsis torques-reginae ITEP-024]
MVADLPDAAFPMLVGVLPQTVTIVPRLGNDLDDECFDYEYRTYALYKFTMMWMNENPPFQAFDD